MPFTIGGEWIPEEKPKKGSGKPVKVRKEKRRNTVVTTVLNLPNDPSQLKALAAQLKKQCGCGGTVKDGIIEIQGDRIDQVRTILRSQGIKAQ